MEIDENVKTIVLNQQVRESDPSKYNFLSNGSFFLIENLYLFDLM